MKTALLVVAVVTVAWPASALPARHTADVLEPGHWSIGAFDPLRVGVTRDVELATHPILDLLLSPNVEARVLFRRVGALRVTGEYGVSVPTFAMRLTQGYLFPSWEKSDNRIGWFVVPSVGLAVSYGEKTVATGRMTTSIGVPIGRNDATTMDTWAPLELLLAPALTGFRSHLTLGLDHPITGWLRGRVSVDGWLIGPSDPPKSQVFLGASGALDLRVSERGTLTLGAIVYDYDQRRTVVERGDDGRWQRKRVRSLDVWPMLDFVYRR
ncbi:MAG: hypothetical protein HYV09_06135 [Deltaproteobacteria bacterium]|nr:hypothetical protein [Deltaproteobacteria bacterium]